MPCSGCIDFDNGMGGENQMAHMDPGGCLYEEEEDFIVWQPQRLTSIELARLEDMLNDKLQNKSKSFQIEFDMIYKITEMFIEASRKRDYKTMRQIIGLFFNSHHINN